MLFWLCSSRIVPIPKEKKEKRSNPRRPQGGQFLKQSCEETIRATYIQGTCYLLPDIPYLLPKKLFCSFSTDAPNVETVFFFIFPSHPFAFSRKRYYPWRKAKAKRKTHVFCGSDDSRGGRREDARWWWLDMTFPNRSPPDSHVLQYMSVHRTRTRTRMRPLPSPPPLNKHHHHHHPSRPRKWDKPKYLGKK